MVQDFHEGFDTGFWDLKVGQFLDRVSVYGSSYTYCNGDKGIGFPPVILYNSFNQGGVFGVFVCIGQFWESVVVVSEFYEKTSCIYTHVLTHEKTLTHFTHSFFMQIEAIQSKWIAELKTLECAKEDAIQVHGRL